MRADTSDGDAWDQVSGLTPRVMPVLRAELVGAALRSGRGPGHLGLVLVSLVYFLFPKKQEEEPLLAQYRAQDPVRPAGPTPRRIAT